MVPGRWRVGATDAPLGDGELLALTRRSQMNERTAGQPAA